MTLTKRFSRLGTCAVLSVAAMLSPCSGGHVQEMWEPEKPIDFVIMAGRGGGADKMARLLQEIVDKNGWSPQPLVPINQPGGSGAEALARLNSTSDPDHTIMVTLNSFYTTPIRQPRLGIDIANFIPIARMAEDTFVLWVNQDSEISQIDEFVRAAREKGSRWIMAGTGRLSEDQLLTDFLNAAYGLEMTYVPYKGGGQVAKGLAAGHAHSTVNNPSEQQELYEAGTSVPIASFTDKRLPMIPEAPTFRELGKDFVYYMQRSVVGAPGMKDAAVAFYQALFAKVFTSEEWSTYRVEKSLQGELLQGEALIDYWIKERAMHRDMLRNMGAIE